MEDKETEKKTSKSPDFELVEVPVQMSEAIKDTKTNTTMSANEALVLLLNEVRLIKKNLGA